MDKTKSNYTLDIPDSKRHPIFHISVIRRYVEPQLELFPNRQRRQPRISPSEQDLNLEIEKIIGHEHLRNNVIRFLCKWEGFPNEDVTFCDAEHFKTSPYGIKVVKEYLLSFGEPPEELIAWTECTDWMKDVLDEWKKSEERKELLKKLPPSSKGGRM